MNGADLWANLVNPGLGLSQDRGGGEEGVEAPERHAEIRADQEVGAEAVELEDGLDETETLLLGGRKGVAVSGGEGRLKGVREAREDGRMN